MILTKLVLIRYVNFIHNTQKCLVSQNKTIKQGIRNQKFKNMTSLILGFDIAVAKQTYQNAVDSIHETGITFTVTNTRQHLTLSLLI